MGESFAQALQERAVSGRSLILGIAVGILIFTGSAHGEPGTETTDTDANEIWNSGAFETRIEGLNRTSEREFWQVLPAGLMYKSYLAGEKEPRFQFVSLVDKDRGLIWEAALGGRAGLIRYGTADIVRPQGWQLDLEGAVLARVDPEAEDDLEAADFRAGFVSTWRSGPTAYKAGYYHLSSHVGDEFLIRNPGFDRLNYVRDSLLAGVTHDLTMNVQVYGEVAYAFNFEDGAKPLELQGGLQYSPFCEGGPRGAPFAGMNIHLREDFNYRTSVNLVAGWQWRGQVSNHTLRSGFQYYNGPSMQYSFVNRNESLLGGGVWFDY